MINTWAIMQKAQADRLIYINSDDERSRCGKQACCGEQACPALGRAAALKPEHAV